MAYVDGWKSPVLLIHGDDDRNVEFRQDEELVEALRARHVEFQQLIFPNEIHDFLLQRSWVTAYQAMADFFESKLGTEPIGAATHSANISAITR
jgi:dipeptidyl aminopeptidase/acylaminoacyl peptidase